MRTGQKQYFPNIHITEDQEKRQYRIRMIKREELKKESEERVKLEPQYIILSDRTKILKSELTEEMEEREVEFGFNNYK